MFWLILLSNKFKVLDFWLSATLLSSSFLDFCKEIVSRRMAEADRKKRRDSVADESCHERHSSRWRGVDRLFVFRSSDRHAVGSLHKLGSVVNIRRNYLPTFS